jgi:hypothetical protein
MLKCLQTRPCFKSVFPFFLAFHCCWNSIVGFYTNLFLPISGDNYWEPHLSISGFYCIGFLSCLSEEEYA